MPDMTDVSSESEDSDTTTDEEEMETCQPAMSPVPMSESSNDPEIIEVTDEEGVDPTISDVPATTNSESYSDSDASALPTTAR